jgi:hypothetical protein
MFSFLAPYHKKHSTVEDSSIFNGLCFSDVCSEVTELVELIHGWETRPSYRPLESMSRVFYMVNIISPFDINCVCRLMRTM